MQKEVQKDIGGSQVPTPITPSLPPPYDPLPVWTVITLDMPGRGAGGTNVNMFDRSSLVKQTMMRRLRGPHVGKMATKPLPSPGSSKWVGNQKWLHKGYLLEGSCSTVQEEIWSVAAAV